MVERVLRRTWWAQLIGTWVIWGDDRSLSVFVLVYWILRSAILRMPHTVSDCSASISRSGSSRILESKDTLRGYALGQHIGRRWRSAGAISGQTHADFSWKPARNGVCWVKSQSYKAHVYCYAVGRTSSTAKHVGLFGSILKPPRWFPPYSNSQERMLVLHAHLKNGGLGLPQDQMFWSSLRIRTHRRTYP